ncbi:MAG: glycine-rich protein [Crocinitomicaceae bacterium]|nr:glycine-rich protein [Crocinitomicaceae bacterium]
MKKNLFKVTLGLSLLAFAQNANAQCPEITCAPDVPANTDSAMCDAIVTYALPTAIDTCQPANFQTFTYTGVQETFVVPAGVTSISVDAYGAQGGSNSPATNINFGGRVQADLPVTPGTTIYVYVGGQPTGLTGGFNGGGNGESGGIGGGGASDLRIGGTTYAERVIVAGGAGGGGFWSSQEIYGGLGGDSIGGPGYRDNPSILGGDPGTQTLSGNGTCVSFNNPAVSGGFGFGGAPSGCGCEGYGGGGGWYGGAGSGNCRGGGGGSSYTDPTTSNVIHAQGVRTGNGEITITWAGATATVTQIAGLPSGSAFPIGTTTNTFIAESNGGVDTCSFVVTVADNQAPTISCPQSIDICDGTAVSGTTPSSSDNCPGETVTYNTTGATTTSGTGSVDGVTFNVGTTTVWYIATDAAGNQDSCSFDVTVNPLPAVIIDAFGQDTVCNYNNPIPLPVGTPASGTYTGPGISGSNFDPSTSGDGLISISYTVTDSLGCTNSDTTSIFVDACVGMNEFNPLSNVSVFPNPSNGLVTISHEDINGSFDYTVTSIDGKVVRQTMNSVDENVTIDLSQEPNGTYLILIESGRFQRTLKLVKD